MGMVDNHQAPFDSTTATLAGNATYRGPTKSVANKGRLVGTVFSDVAGTLSVQQSSDGQNFDQATSIAVAAGVGQGFSVEIVAPWAQLVYTNGAGAQATFRLSAFTRLI